jgi:hypothetical protein
MWVAGERALDHDTQDVRGVLVKERLGHLSRPVPSSRFLSGRVAALAFFEWQGCDLPSSILRTMCDGGHSIVSAGLPGAYPAT